ncbi:hypothetical protein ACFL6U_18670 [Planctomycetota bacterium]
MTNLDKLFKDKPNPPSGDETNEQDNADGVQEKLRKKYEDFAAMQKIKHARRRTVTFFAFLTGVLIVLAWHMISVILPSTIGSYPAQKLENGDLRPLNRTIYKVNPFTQTVIYWKPGVNETPKRLVDCVVRNKKNWIGYFPGGSGPVQMLKGTRVRYTNDPDNIVYVDDLRWWLLHYTSKE